MIVRNSPTVRNRMLEYQIGFKAWSYGSDHQNREYKPTNPGDPYNYWDHFPKPGTRPNKQSITPVMSLPQRGPYRTDSSRERDIQQSARNFDFQPGPGISTSNRYEGLLNDIDYRPCY